MSPTQNTEANTLFMNDWVHPDFTLFPNVPEEKNRNSKSLNYGAFENQIQMGNSDPN